MNKLWNALEHKGKFTTIIGVLIILGSIIYPLIKHNKGVEFTQVYMVQTLYFVLSGIILIILPSKISISKDGFIIED